MTTAEAARRRVQPATDGAGRIRVVAFGGGHGLSASLRALRRCEPALDLDITAVVTVADDGGSSGRLRAERDALLPPGDLRQALAALADDGPVAQRTATLLQYRFGPAGRPAGAGTVGPAQTPDAQSPGGSTGSDPGRLAGARDAGRLPGERDAGQDPLAGHAVGNLVLLGLMELLGDPVLALDHASTMVGARGRVLPMARHAIGIEADVRDGDPGRPGELVTVRGQHAVAVAAGHVEAVRLTPASPPTCPVALAAIAGADWLIFGPGSWYTSVLPHLLVPELAAAIVASPARRAVTLNLAADNETAGLSVADHLAALRWYLPELRVDAVLADPRWVGEEEPVRDAAKSLGARLVLAPLAVADGSPRHDPEALGVALVPVLGAAR